MCEECKSELGRYYLGEYEEDTSSQMEQQIMEVLGITGGYLIASKTDSYALEWAKKQAANSFGANFKSAYYRNAVIGGAGLLAVYATEPDMKVIKDFGKGAIVYSVKELIAAAMPTLGIGNPNTIVQLGQPNSILKIEQPNSILKIEQQQRENDMFRTAAISENKQMMEEIFKKTDKVAVRLSNAENISDSKLVNVSY